MHCAGLKADMQCVGIMRDSKDVQRACTSMSPTLDRGLTTPSERVLAFGGANWPGPGGFPSSLRQICSRSRCKPMPRHGDRAVTARFKPRFTVLSSNRTTPEVDQATQTEAFADIAQLRAAGHEESAHQSIPAKLLDLNPPALALQPSHSKTQAAPPRSTSFLRGKAVRCSRPI